MKILLTVVLIILLLSDTLGQTAKVDETLIITDGAGGIQTINFGLDPLATDGIDAELDEASLPPLPPAGVFDARFNLPGGTDASLKDYRQAGVPDTAYSGKKAHEIQFQVGSGTTIRIDWNLPSDLSITGRLQDVVLGTIIDTPMAGTGYYTVTDPSVYSKLKLTVTYSAVVPVELTSFTASVEKNSIKLNWITATELNNKGFEIQRKLNTKWEKLCYINGNGTTTNPHEYNYTDNLKFESHKGIVGYRLKQIDLDGSYHYSYEIKLNIDCTPKEFKLYQNYPNPFNPSTTIKYALPFESSVDITIYNMIGQKIEEFEEGVKEAGYHNVNWQPKSLSSGAYFYSINTKSTDGKNSYSKTLKMLYMK